MTMCEPWVQITFILPEMSNINIAILKFNGNYDHTDIYLFKKKKKNQLLIFFYLIKSKKRYFFMP